MYYELKDGHPLPRDPFKACVAPRPIGWISTLDREGRANLAPFSYFNALQDNPPMVMFSAGGSHRDGGLKDTARNAIETGEFVFNMATWDLREAMNASSASVARDVDEFELAGLEKAPSTLVKPPRVAESPIHFECRTFNSIELPAHHDGVPNNVVIGEVVAVHIADEVLRDGFVDLTLVKPIARLGYMEYAVVKEIFTMDRP